MPGHIKVPHRDDLIGLEAAYKNLAVAQVKIKQLSINDEINVYLYIIEDKIKSCWLFQIYFGQ